MKIFKTLLYIFILTFFFKTNGFSQANPGITVMPSNSGLVSLGNTIDLEVTVGNSGTSSIPAFKLRPIITVPPIVTILPNIQQTGLPAGWSIVSNTGSQIRICNGTDMIAGFTTRIISIKVQGVTIGGPSTLSGQINFANGVNCAIVGTPVSGNNTADDFATSIVQVIPGCSLGVSAVAGVILCNNGNTTITASVSAATGPVEYSITGGAPFQTSNVFSNVVAGSYTVTVREVNNPSTCVASTVLNVIAPPPIPTPTLSIVQPTCISPSAVVSITSSTTGLTFSIDGGLFSAYPTAGYLLTAGTHTITAKNMNDCTSLINTFIVNAQPATPATPLIGAVTQPDCTVSTGSVILNNLPIGSWTIEPGTLNGNSTSTNIINLAAGSYSFIVTNTDGCSSLPSTNVNFVAVVGAPQTPVVSLSQPTCSTATGTILITSPTLDLTFSLDGGAFAAYPTGGYTAITVGTHTLIAQNIIGCLSPFVNITIDPQPASPPAPIITVVQPNCTVATGTITVTSPTAGLTFSLDGSSFAPYPVSGYIVTAGIHSLAVQNLSGCTPNVTNNIIVNAQPTTPTVSLEFTPITCFNGSSVLTVTATGGVLPYEYSVNGGIFQSVNIFNIIAGSYTIAVKDANGCVGNNTGITITQPTAITATATASSIACNGGNAILTVTANGGSGAYEYSLNNGNFQPMNTFNVVAGSYAVKVRIQNNASCSTTVNSILNVTQPGILKASANANAIKICGGNSVSTVTATGGTPPYSGIGSFLREPGTWNFVVVDSKGCSTSEEVTILPPGCVEIKVYPNPSQSFIAVNHSAAVDASSYLQIFSENGIQVLTKYIPQNNFITNVNISALSSGNYVMVYINGGEKKATKFIKTSK